MSKANISEAVLMGSVFTDIPLVPRSELIGIQQIKTKVSQKWRWATLGLAATVGIFVVITLLSNWHLFAASRELVDCGSLFDAASAKPFQAGVYDLTLLPNADNSTKAFCTDEGWTVIQSRGQFGNPIDYFYRDWAEYVRGFGVPGKEYWLGLDPMYFMTNTAQYKLRVKLSDVDGNEVEYHYGKFKIMNREKYNLLAEDYSGPDGGDSLAYHNGIPFTTRDRNNDIDVNNCASHHKSAWWFVACFHSNLNGRNYHMRDSSSLGYGMAWRGWKGDHHSLKTVEMAIKRVT